MLCSYRRIFIVVTLAFAITSIPALGNKILHTLQDEEFPVDVHSVGYSSNIAHETVPEGSVERLQQELDDDTPPFAAVGDRAVSSDQVEGEQEPAPQSRRKRFSVASEEQQPDTSGYAAALDALLGYHAEVQSEAVDIPDIHKQSSEKVLFFPVTTRMSLTSLRMRVPATLRRVSSATAETLPDGGVDMSCNVRLGDLKTWGKYDFKVNDYGQTGEFERKVRDRFVHATIRFRELPAAAAVTSTTAATPVDAGAEEETTAAAPARCSLEATELTLVQRGSEYVPAVLSSFVSHLEDVPTTLRVVKQVLNERLAQFPCGDGFVAMVRRGYVAPS